jgi:hypothetical protein
MSTKYVKNKKLTHPKYYALQTLYLQHTLMLVYGI